MRLHFANVRQIFTFQGHRYDVHTDEHQIEMIFGWRFNMAPTQRVPVVKLEDNKPVRRQMQWGLIPFLGGSFLAQNTR